MASRGTALYVRHRRNLGMLLRFAVVGGSGVLINLATLVVLRRLGPHFDEAVVSLGTSDFNLRWYHVYSTIAFLVANLSNFQLNRTWTFRSSRHSRWWHEYWPFLVVGFGGQVVGLVLLTLLMHPHSPVSLPADVFDDSSGLRSRLYWSQLIVIGFVMPVSFVLNKLWTFAAVRTGHPDLADPLFEEQVVVEEDVVRGETTGSRGGRSQ